MKRLLIGGSINPRNKGDQARVKGSVRFLSKVDGNLRLALFSHAFDEDRRVYAEDGIEIVRAPWSQKHIKVAGMVPIAFITLIKYSFLRLAKKYLRWPVKDRLFEYDGFIIISGFDFSDLAGRWPMYYGFFLIALFNIVMGKPVMCCAQSMGPIENRWVRVLAQFFIRRTEVITVREERSRSFLNSLNIDGSKVRLTADPAFLLRDLRDNSTDSPATYALDRLPRPVIGISVCPKPFAGPETGYCSVGFYYRVNRDRCAVLSSFYIGRMAQIADWLVETYGASLVFVPNCTAKTDDDRETIRAIWQRMQRRDNVVCITDEITLDETLNVIGRCDMFIATRLHASLFAAITGVPLVPLVGVDGPRIPGVLQMLNLDRFVRNIVTSDIQDILATIDDIWQHREELRLQLDTATMEADLRARDNITFILQEL